MLTSRLSSLINAYLKSDPEQSEAFFKAHENKIIALQFRPMNKMIYFNINNNGTPHLKSDPDTVITGSILDFCSRNPRNLDITGDSLLAHDFNRVLSSIDFDWQDALSTLTGDTPVYILKNITQTISQNLNNFNASFKRSVTEYIQEEKQQCPTRAELTDFYRDVDELKDATERLDVKLALLLNTL